MIGLLRHRDFRLLFLGLATSMVGDSMMLLVFGIWVKALTGSNASAAMVLFVASVPFVLSPFGGWLLDRIRRRTYLIVANIASATGLLPLLAVLGRDQVWIIFVVAFFYGISMVSSGAALNGLLKELLPAHELVRANAALQTVKEGLRLAGPLTGAVLFAAFGGATVAAVDAGTFLLGAITLATMRLREPPPQPATLGWPQEMSAGLRHLRSHPALGRMTSAASVTWLAIGLSDATSFAIVDQGLHRSPTFVSILSTSLGAGCLLGGLCCTTLIVRSNETTAMAISLAVLALGSSLCTVVDLRTVLAGKLVYGLGFTIFTIAFTTALQRNSPPSTIGRVATAAEALTSGPQMLALAAGAALVSLVDYRLLLATTTLGNLAATLLLCPIRSRQRSKYVRVAPQPQPEGRSSPGTPSHL